jgi:adenylate cyclase
MDKHTRQMFIGSIIIALCCITLFSAGVFHEYQQRLSDSLYGGKPALQDIVIIGIDDKSLQEIGRWPWPRERFASIVEKLNGSAAIGIDVAFFEPSTSRSDAIFAAAVNNRPVVLVSEYTNFTADMRGGGLLRPRSPIEAKTGYANILTDPDGVVRSMNLNLGDEQAFSAAVYEVYSGQQYPSTSRFLINYVGPPRSYTRYSATDVLKGRVPANAFDGKIVLLGAVARDFHDEDLVPTSNGEPMSGVEIHANAIQTMLLKNELQTVPWWVTTLAILLVCVVLALLVLRFSVFTAGLFAFIFVVVYITAAFYLFEEGIILNIFYIPFTTVVAFIVFVAMDLVHERSVRGKVASAFGKYVSPTLVKQIMEKEVELGGERKVLTILFSDIRGFTSISEKLTPEELVEFLNSYFTRVTGLIMREQGLVDKFIGDAIMAFWNAPVTVEEHADFAVTAALAMRATLDVIRKEHEGKYPRLEVGIGINTGEAIVGNIGSAERLSYTAIGDSVNLASRLESLTKEYGVQIIISHNTKKVLKRKFVLRELDCVKVKGKKEPVTLYEVVDETVKKKELDQIKLYEKALHLYYEGKFKEAVPIFKAVNDKASHVLIERCEEFMKDKPKNWDGAYEMTHK